MTTTIIALSLLILLMITLELSHRASAKHVRELRVAHADIEGLKEALAERDKDVRHYAHKAREGVSLLEGLADYSEALAEACGAKDERILNLCAQLEEARKGRRKYHDVAAERASRIQALEAIIEDLQKSNYSNLSGLGGLSALQQENKLDALCEVIKTLMQRDQLCDAAVASFGGRLSRAVQVHRRERLRAVPGPTPCLIPGLAHLIERTGSPAHPNIADF